MKKGKNLGVDPFKGPNLNPNEKLWQRAVH